MEDTTKKILIDIQLKADTLKTDVVSLNSTLDQLLVQQLKLKAAGQQNTSQFVQLASQIRNTKTEIRNANKEIDNTNKALNAENNSIAQNRALLSILTAEYVKLGQEQGKTAKSTIEAGKQIDALTTKLKAQEAAIGQNYRNVGNYADAFKQWGSVIGNIVPGVNKFSSAITGAANAFNLMGNSSKAAAAGESEVAGEAGVATDAVEGMGIAGGAVVAVLVAVTIGLYAVGKYLSQFASYADAGSKTWEKFKAQTESIANTIASGDWKHFGENLHKAGDEAQFATGNLIELGREAQNAQTLTQAEDMQVNLLLLKIRDKATHGVEAEKLYQQALVITNQQYKRNSDLAKDAYQNTLLAAEAGYNLTEEQKKGLSDLSKGYASVLDYAHQLVYLDGVNKDFLDKINPALQGIIQVDSKKELTDQRLKNRDDAKAARDEQYAEKEKQLQLEITRATEEANSQRIASITHMVEFEEEAFGKEISSTDEHYRQLIFKQQEFIKKQQAIADNPKHNAKTRTLASKAVTAGKSDINQLQQEKNAESEKLLVEHNRAMLDMVTKGALDLKNIQIANINDNQKRELASIDNSFAAKTLQYAEKNHEYQGNIRRLTNEVTDKKKDINDPTKVKDKGQNENELQALQTTLNAQNALLFQNADAVVASEKAKTKAIDETNKKYHEQMVAQLDQVNIIDAGNKGGLTGGKNNPFNKDLLDAKRQQLLDEQNAELEQTGITEQQKYLIRKQYADKDKDLVQQNNKEKAKIELDATSIVTNAAFSIISNGLKAQAQAAEVQLSKDKERELSNTSLTSAQKLAINNKYRQKEGQEKVKEFKADQKLSIAKAIIATAQAVVEALTAGPVSGEVLAVIAAATGAAEIGIIAAQTPPAYAKGGTFKSDGKGSVLPGYSKKDNVNAQLRSGEAVIVSEAVADPYARSILSSINVAYGGRSFGQTNPGTGYAIGGIVMDGNNSNRYYNQPQQGIESMANSIAYSLINNFPPVYVDVKDINNQQAILTKTTNRVNF